MLASRMDRATLLVAEPNALQRQLIDMMLSVDEMTVVVVGSSREALAYLRENTPTAMLFAIDLPDIDGFALCQKVKAVGRLAQVPVVLVADPSAAGGVGEVIRARARSSGAQLVLQRPLGDKNLRERIARLMRTPVTEPDVSATPPIPLQGADTAAPVFGVTMGAATPQAATELGSLRAEVAQLRTDNAALKERVAKYKALAQTLEQQLEEERRKPRFPFGRRG